MSYQNTLNVYLTMIVCDGELSWAISLILHPHPHPKSLIIFNINFDSNCREIFYIHFEKHCKY